jgi:adenosylcobinamide-GDP ribazoletransferase
MSNQVATFLLAVQFLTRIPVPTRTIFSPERLNAATGYYPLVGFLVGGLCAGTFWGLAMIFPSALALLLAIGIGLLLTGAFHEDGLADTFDGIGGGQDPDHALSIMKDSRLGTYGTLALVMALAIKFMSLIALPSQWIMIALIVGHGLSRLSSVVVIATSRYARADGKAKPVAEGVSASSLAFAVLTGLIGLTAASAALPTPALVAGFIGLSAGHVGMRLMFERKLKGYTGDTLGAVQQASELGFYLGLVAWLF